MPKRRPLLVLIRTLFAIVPYCTECCGSGDEGAWLEETWYALGQFLRMQCANAEAYVVSGNPGVTKKLFMKASAKWPVTVGGIECRILCYQVLPKREPKDD